MFFKLEFVCWVFFDTLARVTVVGHVKNIHGVVMVFLEDATLQEKEIKKGKAVYRYYSMRFADRGDHMYKIQVSFTGEFWKLTYFGGVLYCCIFWGWKLKLFHLTLT